MFIGGLHSYTLKKRSASLLVLFRFTGYRPRAAALAKSSVHQAAGRQLSRSRSCRTSSAGGGAAAWIDAEHAFSPPFAAQLSVDVSRFPVAMPVSAEQAGAIARHFLASGTLDLVAIDSAAAMVAELESGAMIGPGGLQSRVLGSELRKLAAAAASGALY